MEEVNPVSPPADFLAILERKGYLSAYQTQKTAPRRHGRLLFRRIRAEIQICLGELRASLGAPKIRGAVPPLPSKYCAAAGPTIRTRSISSSAKAGSVWGCHHPQHRADSRRELRPCQRRTFSLRWNLSKEPIFANFWSFANGSMQKKPSELPKNAPPLWRMPNSRGPDPSRP